MDRIKQLKLAMARLKKRDFKPLVKKRNHGVYIPVASLSEEELENRRKKNREAVKRIYLEKRDKGLCMVCKKPTVMIVYQFEGIDLIKRRGFKCPQHWESGVLKTEMMNVLASSNPTVPTVSFINSLSVKSDASYTG